VEKQSEADAVEGEYQRLNWSAKTITAVYQRLIVPG
jgi:hypothetical protein